MVSAGGTGRAAAPRVSKVNEFMFNGLNVQPELVLGTVEMFFIP